MKEIKLIHLVIIVILVLLSVAILQWTKLPQSAPPASVSSATTSQPVELPVLPQNEIYNSKATPSFLKELPSFEESSGTNVPEPKDKPKTGKAML
ncbi:MAG: hypothetical protein PHV97_03815 [Candidatus Omnitrophica bacterium]|nr:hypothetical protein [Candidatus Omnitrophota bacterium]